jgi:hypothetical protein
MFYAWQLTHLSTCRMQSSLGISKRQRLKKKRRYSPQHSDSLSAHPNDLIELPDNKTPAKWSACRIPRVIVVFVTLVFKLNCGWVRPVAYVPQTKHSKTLLPHSQPTFCVYILPLTAQTLQHIQINSCHKTPHIREEYKYKYNYIHLIKNIKETFGNILYDYTKEDRIM